jgi:hypothetical protein
MNLVGLRKLLGVVLGILALVSLAALDAIWGVPSATTIAICITSVATGHQLAQGLVDVGVAKNEANNLKVGNAESEPPNAPASGAGDGQSDASVVPA